MTVAPHAGAWIETIVDAVFRRIGIVAPHAGAWIETYKTGKVSKSNVVAPHAGAWIETRSPALSMNLQGCRTPRGCVD